MLITSSQNAALKRLRALYKDKKYRKSEGVFIAEGVNLVKDIPDRFEIDELFIKESRKDELSFIADRFGKEPYVVKDSLFDATSDTRTPSGVIAVVKRTEEIKSAEGDIVLLLDGISDSGNLGTIIRTAAARGIKTVICASCADAFSPKTVRAAMSGTFRTEIIETDVGGALGLLSDYRIVGLDMGGKCIYGYKREGKTAIAVGSEAHGLGEEVRKAASDTVSIPMENGVESLNAAVSISIAMYLIQ